MGEEDILYGHRMSEWQQIRPLAQGVAYFDPETKIAYSHADYLAEDVQGRLLQKKVFESHSQRAYFFIEQNALNEYKGLTLPYSDALVPASGQPRGLLLTPHGAREAAALNDSAKRAGRVNAEYHTIGRALLKRADSTVVPLRAARENGSDGEIIRYGVLRRWGEDYIPFIRLDLFQIVRQLAIMENVDHIELLSNAVMRLGLVLRAAHERGIYHCFTHPGNVDAHGNLIDYEHALYRDEIPAIKEAITTKSAEIALFNEEGLRFRDVDLFFGGAREVIKRCRECFRLSHEDLMTRARFLRENVSLSVGIPVFEALAHLNIGFYEDTIKKLPVRDQRRIIASFIDSYCSAGERIKENVVSELARYGGWSERASGFITQTTSRQISGEFILNVWKQPPLKP